ncbi:MAG TPA: hypothetical protein VF541_23250 [Longimicrobium sp.]
MQSLFRLTVLAASLTAAAPLRAQAPVEVHAGDAIVNAARLVARTDTFAMAFESGAAALLVIRTALAGEGATASVLRVERISALTGEQVSVDSFSARRPALQPLADVQRHAGDVRTLLFPPGAVTGKKEHGGVRTSVNARLDPPAFYGNTTDLLLASLPLEQGRQFRVAMWHPDRGAYTLVLNPAARATVQTVDGGTCDAWEVEAEEPDGPSTYWVERQTRTLLAYRAEGLELRIVHHPSCPPSANGRRESR